MQQQLFVKALLVVLAVFACFSQHAEALGRLNTPAPRNTANNNQAAPCYSGGQAMPRMPAVVFYEGEEKQISYRVDKDDYAGGWSANFSLVTYDDITLGNVTGTRRLLTGVDSATSGIVQYNFTFPAGTACNASYKPCALQFGFTAGLPEDGLGYYSCADVAVFRRSDERDVYMRVGIESGQAALLVPTVISRMRAFFGPAGMTETNTMFYDEGKQNFNIIDGQYEFGMHFNDSLTQSAIELSTFVSSFTAAQYKAQVGVPIIAVSDKPTLTASDEGSNGGAIAAGVIITLLLLGLIGGAIYLKMQKPEIFNKIFFCDFAGIKDKMPCLKKNEAAALP